MSNETFWIAADLDHAVWQEVDEAKFREVERSAGFMGKTGGFTGGGSKGRVLFEPDVDSVQTIKASYSWDPFFVESFLKARVPAKDVNAKANIAQLVMLLRAVLPESMGGTPDLFAPDCGHQGSHRWSDGFPDTYDDHDSWDCWEEQAKAVLAEDLGQDVSVIVQQAIDAKAEVKSLKSRLREVDYIVQNEDSLDVDACAALRAVVFDIPDPRRPSLPEPTE